jgi:hypothetical protein
MHNEEELMLEMGTCAMAFRLLRMHGYDITSGTAWSFRTLKFECPSFFSVLQYKLSFGNVNNHFGTIEQMEWLNLWNNPALMTQFMDI